MIYTGSTNSGPIPVHVVVVGPNVSKRVSISTSHSSPVNARLSTAAEATTVVSVISCLLLHLQHPKPQWSTNSVGLWYCGFLALDRSTLLSRGMPTRAFPCAISWIILPILKRSKVLGRVDGGHPIGASCIVAFLSKGR